jgi:putative ABC transport system substrate-binding protein
MRPGGSITGTATLFPELAAKRLDLVEETLPGVSRVAVLWNAAKQATPARSKRQRSQPEL